MDIKESWLLKRPVAHRGFHNGEYPENSVPAFLNAAKNGYAAELDVRLLDDGSAAVFHDESLTRMTSGDGYICSLKKTDLKKYKLAGTQYPIPSLEEVLEAVAGKTPVLIEIKNDNPPGTLEAKVIEILSSYRGETAIQSFNPGSLEYFFKNAPHILRGQLSSNFTKEEMRSFLKRYMLKRLKLNSVSKPDFISYRFSDLPCKAVTQTKLPVLAWTVRSAEEMKDVSPYCDNIIFEKFIP